MTLKTIRHNPLLPALYLPSLLFAFCEGMLIPVLPLFAGELGASYGLIGLVLAASSLGTLLGDVPAGLLLRHWGRKRTLLLGLSCLTLATAALFWAPSIPAVVALRFLAGLGRSLFAITRHVYVADTVSFRKRGRAIALLGGVGRVGRFGGPALGGFVAAAYGLRAPFLLYAGLGVLALLIVAVFARMAEPELRQPPAQLRPHSNRLGQTLKAQYHILASAGAGQILMQFTRTGPRVIIPLHAAAVGLDIQAIGLILSAFGVIDMTLFYPVGIIMDRWGRKYAIVPSLLLLAGGLALLPWARSFASLAGVAALLGLGNGLGSGSMMTLGADLAPRDAQGEFLGLWRLVGDAGSSSGPLVVGGIADLFRLDMAAWSLSGIGILAVAVFLLLVPDTPRSPQPASVTIDRSPL